MDLVYSQSTGDLSSAPTANSPGQLLCRCYSGCGTSKNCYTDEGLKSKGPIPHGIYTFSGPPIDTRTHGPAVIWLTPDAETRLHILALGRGPDSFGMHSDSVVEPGTASEGCIVNVRAVQMPAFIKTSDFRHWLYNQNIGKLIVSL